jgi:predicted transcriptional regulator
MPSEKINTQGIGKKGVSLSLSEIRDTLRADVLVGHDMMDLEVDAGAGSDLMSDLLRGPTSGVVLLSGLNTIQVIRSAVIAGMSAVVLIRGKQPAPEMIELAEEHELPLLSSPFTMYTASGRLFIKGLRGIEGKKD